MQILRGRKRQLPLFTALASALSFSSPTWAEEEVIESEEILVTAREQQKQAPGVSIITAEDIKKAPPANDLSEIIRKQPGINLTGNSSSGARGNNRQIDIRGMGPENTLILVDGKPIASRNSVRYGWRGDRDTRGDTNWVPAEQVERIEVLRGPAAARYGNGAAGGVINIITKAPTDEHHGNATAYMNFPEHSAEGATRRTNLGLSGPLTDHLSYRLYGNVTKTEADDVNINSGHTVSDQITTAGREGLRNRDVNGMLSWRMNDRQTVDFEAGFSRQGNIYTNDSMLNVGAAPISSARSPWLGRETNTMYRENYAVTHRGLWDSGATTQSYIQYERTRNKRLQEGLAGAAEGNLSANNLFGTTELKNTTVHSELSLPLSGIVDQVLTVGAEWVQQKMDDPFSNTQAIVDGSIPGISSTNRSTQSSARIASLFVEDNIEVRPGTIVTTGVRFDHHDIVGNNWSPSLNLSQELGSGFTIKAGIARAYKAPNLYQLNPNYVLYSRGQGCWGGRSCYLQGNDKLDAETSINKELGIEFNRDGWIAGITYFRNDYRDKIEAARAGSGRATGGSSPDIVPWANVPKAVVEGLEGTVNVPLSSRVGWNTNFTYMIQSKNKVTGEPLSIIPEYTVNSSLDWQATEALALRGSVVWYGSQTPGKYDFQGNELTGNARREVSPYTLVGFSGTYAFNRNLSIAAGVDNIFDKRLYREGNAYEAGAYTYNEPGRTFFASMTTTF
ncbi:TonB-dependent siderophore receptor [Pectobacterium polaris]|uniref:TonB-dependent siderophore receptor n=1 Tax=Pectobacterium polaris TaxID=2042057 RepID=UPI0032E39113